MNKKRHSIKFENRETLCRQTLHMTLIVSLFSVITCTYIYWSRARKIFPYHQHSMLMIFSRSYISDNRSVSTEPILSYIYLYFDKISTIIISWMSEWIYYHWAEKIHTLFSPRWTTIYSLSKKKKTISIEITQWVSEYWPWLEQKCTFNYSKKIALN